MSNFPPNEEGLNSLISHFDTSLYIDSNSLRLLKLYLAESVEERDVVNYFVSTDIATQPHQKICLIVDLARKLHYRGIPQDIINLLKGAAKLYEAQNATTMHAFYRLLQTYNQTGIDVLVFKGGAMKLLYMKDRIRPMGDVDFLVREGQFEQAKKIAISLGYEHFQCSHHIELTGENYCLELHRFFLKENVVHGDIPEIWDSALKVKWQNTPLTVYVPSSEVMIMNIIANVFVDILLVSYAYHHTRLKWIVDVAAIIKKHKVDFSLLAQISAKSHQKLQMYVMLSILRNIDDSLVTEEQLGLFYPNAQELREINVISKFLRHGAPFREQYVGRPISYFWKEMGYYWIMNRYAGHRHSLLKDALAFPHFAYVSLGQGSIMKAVAKVFVRLKQATFGNWND